ncbi:MAG: STAS domain-containing protein [Nevskiaceae bacterium]|nr:MAG: STAS domain-containing protein [Nevskiaceae bacterium]TBR74439.1 MAG: STAS domain-containing protein [Nevskiaceae bacterium]
MVGDTTVQPGERLTFHEVERLLARADAIVAQGFINLAAVQRFDSAGVALLLELTRRARIRGGQCVVRGCPQSVRALLDFFSVSALLEFEAPAAA